MPRVAKKKKETVVQKPAKVQKTKKTKKAKKVVKKTKKVKEEDVEYIWIYGDTQLKVEAYEFHPELQDYIETCWKKGMPKCQVNIFATVYTIDFEAMTRKKTTEKKGKPIKRIKKSAKRSMKSLLGIEGYDYEKKSEFNQNDNICNICLNAPTIPSRVDNCGHVFCFICLKCNFNMGLDCPTCRGRIYTRSMEEGTVRFDVDMHLECPEEYAKECEELVKQKWSQLGLKDKKGFPLMEPERKSERGSNTKYYWIYKAKGNGWYRFDPKNEKYIEECFLRKMFNFKLFVCGADFDYNLKALTQIRVVTWSYEDSKRKIKRIKASDCIQNQVRGIAGIDTIVYPVTKIK